MGGPNTVPDGESDPLVLSTGLIFLCFETEIMKSHFHLYCESHAPAFMSGLMVLVVAQCPPSKDCLCPAQVPCGRLGSSLCLCQNSDMEGASPDSENLF